MLLLLLLLFTTNLIIISQPAIKYFRHFHAHKKKSFPIELTAEQTVNNKYCYLFVVIQIELFFYNEIKTTTKKVKHRCCAYTG